MSEYRLFETAGFRRDLERLDSEVLGRIRATLQSRVYPVLRVTPRQAPGVARLRDWDPPTWRLRIGSWRIFYEIHDENRVVVLTAAAHRKKAYR